MKRHYVEMRSRSPKLLWRRRAEMARRALCLLPAALVALPASAQRDTVVARRVSTWQTDVDRLKQDLITQRNLETQLFRLLAELETRKRAAVPDSQRTLLAAQSELHSRMLEASAEQGKIRQRIEALCANVRKPEGWLGVVTTGVQLKETRGDGTTLIRFLEPPVVASVDPGSPADRVGVRAGDVLLELGGQRLLQTNVIFADLLRPGKEIVIKLQRGGGMVTLTPMVEPLPEVTTTPCTWVDPATEYVVRPMPARALGRAQVGSGTYARLRRDTVTVVGTAPAASGSVLAGPMVYLYSGAANSLAGLQLMALSTESSRVLGVSHGILVNQVLPGTPGRRAGLQGGDILLSADSVNLRSILQLREVINKATDRVVTLLIVRDRKRETIQLKW